MENTQCLCVYQRLWIFFHALDPRGQIINCGRIEIFNRLFLARRDPEYLCILLAFLLRRSDPIITPWLKSHFKIRDFDVLSIKMKRFKRFGYSVRHGLHKDPTFGKTLLYSQWTSQKPFLALQYSVNSYFLSVNKKIWILDEFFETTESFSDENFFIEPEHVRESQKNVSVDLWLFYCKLKNYFSRTHAIDSSR